MIDEQLVELVRQHPEAARYQCVYQRPMAPQRLGCAIGALGRDLVVMSLHSEARDGETYFYAITETVSTDIVNAVSGDDPRISMAIEAIAEHAAGMRVALVEGRLRAWAEINQNLSLAHHGFAVRIDMPGVIRRDVTIEGRRQRASTPV